MENSWIRINPWPEYWTGLDWTGLYSTIKIFKKLKYDSKDVMECYFHMVNSVTCIIVLDLLCVITSLIRRGSNFYFFGALYFSHLEFN